MLNKNFITIAQNIFFNNSTSETYSKLYGQDGALITHGPVNASTYGPFRALASPLAKVYSKTTTATGTYLAYG